MTDTGQVPGEGLPENAGGQQQEGQPGVPASGTYTFADPADGIGGAAPAPSAHESPLAQQDDEDLLLMPGAQGAWSEQQVVQGQPAPGGPQQQVRQPQSPGPGYAEQQSVYGDPQQVSQAAAGPEFAGGAQPDAYAHDPQAQAAAAAHEYAQAAAQAQAQPQGSAQQPLHEGQFPQEVPHAPGAQAPGAEYAQGDSGSTDPGAAHPSQQPQPAQASTHSPPAPAPSTQGPPSQSSTPSHGTRRPLHLGPPVPEQSGTVRPLSDRGPAPVPAAQPAPAAAPAPAPAAAQLQPQSDEAPQEAEGQAPGDQGQQQDKAQQQGQAPAADEQQAAPAEQPPVEPQMTAPAVTDPQPADPQPADPQSAGQEPVGQERQQAPQAQPAQGDGAAQGQDQVPSAERTQQVPSAESAEQGAQSAEPEYLDVPHPGTSNTASASAAEEPLPGPQLGELPPQRDPWTAQQPTVSQDAAAVAEAGQGAAETVAPAQTSAGDIPSAEGAPGAEGAPETGSDSEVVSVQEALAVQEAAAASEATESTQSAQAAPTTQVPQGAEADADAQTAMEAAQSAQPSEPAEEPVRNGPIEVSATGEAVPREAREAQEQQESPEGQKAQEPQPQPQPQPQDVAAPPHDTVPGPRQESQPQALPTVPAQAGEPESRTDAAVPASAAPPINQEADQPKPQQDTAPGTEAGAGAAEPAAGPEAHIPEQATASASPAGQSAPSGETTQTPHQAAPAPDAEPEPGPEATTTTDTDTDTDTDTGTDTDTDTDTAAASPGASDAPETAATEESAPAGTAEATPQADEPPPADNAAPDTGFSDAAPSDTASPGAAAETDTGTEAAADGESAASPGDEGVAAAEPEAVTAAAEQDPDMPPAQQGSHADAPQRAGTAQEAPAAEEEAEQEAPAVRESGPQDPETAQSPPSPEPPVGEPAPGFAEAEREAVHRLMRERRDIRNGFRSDPIPHEVLLRVLEAAHTAPSVGHSQPWDFVVIRSEETRRTMHELAQRQREAYAKSLPKARAKQFKELKIEAILDTPVNIVVTADPTRGGRHTLGRQTQPQMAPYSSALAVENLWLAARAEGLGVGWVSFFDEREMVRTLELPEHLEVVAYLCVGYVDEFPDEPELMQAGWSKRRPLSWVVHEESYGRRALPGAEPHGMLAETLGGIRPLDAKALGEAWERQKRMTKPSGALGMLEIISAQLCGLSRKCPPPVPEPAAVAVFAGDHGVHAQGVTPWPQEVTAQMVANFLGGGAVCNAFANQVGAEVCVVDVGVAAELPATPGLLPRKVRAGTADMTAGPALTREEVERAVEVGIETARDLVAAGNKALLTGEMGIANTTASAALIAVCTGADPAEVTGRGTGINDETHARKVEVVRRALELHQPDPADALGMLSAFGGLEHAAMVGLILGGASLRTPVILDGVSAGAAALVARSLAPESLAACIAGHRSAEPGHVAALTKLGLRPLVDLDLRLGEGTGALLALPMVQSAARAMHEVATFDAAGVTGKN
ncbi:nicotinate-nucleotide--dimethylbenzimidazole phosphoribosyltransferase [Streptomyces axinellae]|uniref:Nicotinate-nucleotide--dimethylbenzimidazole phosphoribosyltransferase n=1 Tax=Streptomyces axinellae TaxID=552788 RepID=A0ABN3PN95_9ACTN